MIMVIFGAGASYDSLASAPPGPSYVHNNIRPPLADELFSNRENFTSVLAKFPECHALIPYLRSGPKGSTIEHTLEGLKQEAETDPQRSRQMAAIRYYLHWMIWDCEVSWSGVTHGITNYVTLLDQVRLSRQPDETVCLVTFNYDTMIEKALPSVGVTIDDNISQYISNDSFKLFKLHGSVNWGREIDDPPIDMKIQDQERIGKSLVQNAEQLNISTRYRLVRDRPLGVIDGIALFPAIAVPVETKRGYECPEDHLECLRAYLPKITKVLTIGWRATEQHFLNLLKESLNGNVPLLAVAEDQTRANEVIGNIEKVGVRISPRTAADGFTGFVISREAEEFLGR